MLKQTPDRRQFGRRPTSGHGWIKVRGRPPIPCSIANLSKGGALLVLQTDGAGLPFRFRLAIETEGIDSDCEIRHQHANRVGVEFVKKEARMQAERATTDEVDAWNGRRR